MDSSPSSEVGSAEAGGNRPARRFGEFPAGCRSERRSLPAVTAVESGEVTFTTDEARRLLALVLAAESDPLGQITYEEQVFGKGYLRGLYTAVMQKQQASGGVESR